MSRVESERSESHLWRQLEARHTAVVVSETAVVSLVMVLSLAGNLLVCYAVYRNPRLRHPSNYYIISLAVTDILQALCSMPLSVVMLATSRWPFGIPVCYFAAIIRISLAETSVYTMALMASNRYYKIVKPAKYLTIFKKKSIVITALLTWVIPIFLALLVAFAFGQRAKPNPGYGLCILELNALLFPLAGITMYLPYFIMGFCYWKIFKVVKMHNANVSWQTSNVEDVKICKTLFITVLAFVCLWLPAHVIFNASVLMGYFSFPRFVTLLPTLLVFLSSCVNPFIYGFMNRAFKAEFKKFLIPRRTHSIAAENGAHFTG